MKNIKDFLVRLSPAISFGPDPNNELSLSLGITPKDYSPEETLQLPERMAEKMGNILSFASMNSNRLANFRIR